MFSNKKVKFNGPGLVVNHAPAEKSELSDLLATRDKLIREMWLTFKKITDIEQDAEKIPMEDYDIWVAITKHSAIQNRLSG